MENLQVIDEALDGVVANGAEERYMYQQSCFGHFQLMQRRMAFSSGIVHRLLLRDLHHDGTSDDMRFMLGSHNIRFSRVEFCLIIRLKFRAISDTELYEDVPNGITPQVFDFEVIPTLAMQFVTHKVVEQPFPRILKWELTWRPRGEKLAKIFITKMFAEAELTPTKVEKGLWYYQGIDEVGNLYFDEASQSAEHVGELR
ncbi:hypothetical protein Dsin_013461 [Dipteronia sinensis]|uniref:Uncharacterized protein n=1 Tax=Dipteronia sinensis TaxID=43782 RepID=A0AAE0AJZ8_9ROSI|nr:hypothetical protein Dsin_013461 [Dipteronia sinensis]